MKRVQHSSNHLLDFDGDRYDPPSIAATGRYRQPSLKSYETFKPPIRGGDLPLPSRSQNNAPTTPNFTGPIPATSPVSPQTVLQGPNDHSRSSGSGRIRSGSLATTCSSDSKRIFLNTDVTLDVC